MERISKDAATVLHALYSQFLSRRKVGQSKSEARFFGTAESIYDDLCQDLCLEDVEDALRELGRCGYLINDYGEDTILNVYFTDSAIADCENATKDTIFSIADFASKFIP